MNNLKIQGGLFFSLALVLLLCLSAVPAFADEEAELDITVTIQPATNLTVSPVSISFEPPDDISAARFNDIQPGGFGISLAEGVTLTIKSNTAWKLYVKGSAEYFSGPYDKPVTDIRWVDGTSVYTDLTMTDALVYEGSTGTSGINKSVNFRIKLWWAYDEPGSYTYNSVVFTLVNV